MTSPDSPRIWTAADVDAFTDQAVADVEAAARQSPGSAMAILAERASALIAELTAGARDSIRLERQLQAQGATADQIAAVRRHRDRIMTAAGRIFSTAMEGEVQIAPSDPPS